MLESAWHAGWFHLGRWGDSARSGSRWVVCGVRWRCSSPDARKERRSLADSSIGLDGEERSRTGGERKGEAARGWEKGLTMVHDWELVPVVRCWCFTSLDLVGY
jgi:hypothetical protein